MYSDLDKEGDINKEIETLKNELDNILSNPDLSYTEILRIEEINEKLDKIDPIPHKFPKKEVWDKFESEYLTDYMLQSNVPKAKKSGKKLSRHRKFRLVGVAVAAIIIINIFSTLLVGANMFSGFHIFTDELLTIRYQKTDPVDVEGSGFTAFTTINELEEYLGTTLMLPEYLPDDYELSYVIYSDMAKSTIISFSSVKNDGATIELAIRFLSENRSIFIEKDDTEVSVIVHNNIEYNIFDNNGETVIEWVYDGYSYMLSGIIAENQVKKIVNSIN